MQLLWLLLLPLVPPALAQATNDTKDLLWGPYRPNLYFGLRPRIPQSLMTGLMWFGTQDYQGISRTRHACDQGDELDGYTWTALDARRGGVQVIKDRRNNVRLTTEFLKVPGGDHGGSWATRIKGEPLDPTQKAWVSVIFYAGIEGLGGLDLDNTEDENGFDEPISISGSTPDLDDFKIRIVDGLDNQVVATGPHAEKFAKRIGKTHYSGLVAPPGQLWQAKDLILQNIVPRAQEILNDYKTPNQGYPNPAWVMTLSDGSMRGSNMYAVQKVFDGQFQFDVFYESASGNHRLDSETLDEGIPALVASNHKHFQTVFPVPESFNTSNREGLEDFSKEITANLMGGVGYFYGTSIVDKGFAYEWDEEEDDFSWELEDTPEAKKEKGARLTEPRALLTATPARSFFPRGFYWDEGFHLEHIGQWDNDFALEILKDWVGLIDDDGWVAREQILGEEARSKVPHEFQTQIPTNANPPTLTMAVTAFISRVKAASSGPSDADLGLDFGVGGGSQVPLSSPSELGPGSKYLDPALAQAYLRELYAPLKRHYDWFRRTQRGQIKQYGRKARSRTEAYRWRGRSAEHVLTSGMDDYPRGPPHAGELHLDLMSWMGFFTRTMREIAEFVGEKDDEIAFAETEEAILDNLDDLHWSEENQMYCDVGVSEDDDSEFICHKGYLSLFPLLLELLTPDSPKLGATLEILRDPEHLWSPYGIRSLSKSHELFGKGEDYWKGPIWMNMNYLALSALHKTYAAKPGPYQKRAKEIYDELRVNVVNNVFKEYERTGYVWEQYDANTGEGRRSHPFTGWTSLISLILSEKY